MSHPASAGCPTAMQRLACVVVWCALAACGPAGQNVDAGAVDAGEPDAGPPDAGPTVAARCDLGGVWDLVLGGDGGQCRNYARPPSPLTLTSDGGAVHVENATGLASDGGCGLTVRFDVTDSSAVDPLNRQTALALEFMGTTAAGAVTMSVGGLVNCTEVAPVTATRR